MDCSTRTALMTGYYAYHVGTQYGVFSGADKNGMPEQFRLLPQALKDTAGYSTYMAGKFDDPLPQQTINSTLRRWHLGYCKKEFTPMNRGFDKFCGLFLGAHRYYTHMESWQYIEEYARIANSVASLPGTLYNTSYRAWGGDLWDGQTGDIGTYLTTDEYSTVRLAPLPFTHSPAPSLGAGDLDGQSCAVDRGASDRRRSFSFLSLPRLQRTTCSP